VDVPELNPTQRPSKGQISTGTDEVDLGFRVCISGLGMKDLGLWVWVWGSGFGVWGLRFGVQSFGFRGSGLVFRVWGVGFKSNPEVAAREHKLQPLNPQSKSHTFNPEAQSWNLVLVHDGAVDHFWVQLLQPASGFRD